MKMRRTLVAMMSGSLAMSPAGVIFADEAAQTPVTYGDMISLSLTQDGETLSADIMAVYNESGDSSFSVSVTLPASMMGTEEPVVYGFDDVLRVCGEDVYLNVEEIVNIYSELTADDSMTELLSMVGITESWLEIPVPTGSVVDLTLELKRNTTKEEINDALKANANETLKFTMDPIVSSDVIGLGYGAIVDGLSTNVLEVDGRQLVKVVAWYDNEMGYSTQMVRTAKYLMEK